MMRIIDISQELFSCAVFPGDNPPERRIVETIDSGSIYNLTAFSMCAHNGTHVDAPYHFYKDGKTIDQIDLSKFVGKCYVGRVDGIVSKEIACKLLKQAKEIDPESAKKILIAGEATVSLEAAEVFAEEGIDLIGNESQTIGPKNAPAAVHYVLLKEEIVLLEGIRLKDVAEGVYFLNTAPINLAGSDGAPCRAVLIEL